MFIKIPLYPETFLGRAPVLSSFIFLHIWILGAQRKAGIHKSGSKVCRQRCAAARISRREEFFFLMSLRKRRQRQGRHLYLRVARRGNPLMQYYSPGAGNIARACLSSNSRTYIKARAGLNTHPLTLLFWGDVCYLSFLAHTRGLFFVSRANELLNYK